MSTESAITSGKRGQADEPDREQSPKRRRVSDGKQSSEHNIPPAAEDSGQENIKNGEHALEEEQRKEATTRRKSGQVDEKQRSRRLFGSLLGTLGQGADKKIKRRQEIEDRRKAELRRQDDVRNEDRQRNVKQLTEKRKQDQWEVDEEDMRIRHRAMRHTAKFLQTQALPKLYYRPWELRAEEEQLIKAQCRRVEDQVDDEVEDFEERRKKVVSRVAVQQDDASPTHSDNQPDNTERPHDGATHTAADDLSKASRKVEQTAEMADTLRLWNEVEQEDDHMVDGEEDAVIY